MSTDSFGKVKDVAAAVFGVYFVCVCIFMAYRAVEGVVLFFDREPAEQADYVDPESGCHLKAVYREAKLIGYNPVWEGTEIKGCPSPTAPILTLRRG